MVPASSGLLNALLPDFERQSGYHVQVSVANQNIYDIARTGGVDLVISHFGFPGAEAFVLDGLGQWPQPIFASQAVILGPPDDPAQIGGAADAVEAFRQIAATKSRFIVNNDPNVKVLVDVMLEAIGRPDRTDWFFDSGLEGADAADRASSERGYTIWGIDPFLLYLKGHPLNLAVLFSNDPILQRIMVSIVVTSKSSGIVNIQGATALQEYLKSAAVQARIRAFRYPGLPQQFWWPEAQHGLPPDKVH